MFLSPEGSNQQTHDDSLLDEFRKNSFYQRSMLNGYSRMPKNFMPGLELCGFCYSEIIKPILDLNFPDIRYSAALIGAGSEVLGFNTEMSQDHDWGLRVKLFFNEDDFAVKAKQIKTFIKGNLPNQFRAHPV